MFLKKMMNEFTGDSSDKTALIREKIQQADAVVIGAGAGLSTAAGFTYTPAAFTIMTRWKNTGLTGADIFT